MINLYLEVEFEKYWDIVPKDTSKENQHIAEVRRGDRRLPKGHRMRGDVS